MKIVNQATIKIAAIVVCCALSFSLLSSARVAAAPNTSEGNSIQLERGGRFTVDLNTLGLKKRGLTIKSDRPSVAAVSKDAVITAKNPGDATIRLFATNDKKACYHVSVSETHGLLNNQMLTKHGAYQCKNLMIVAHPDDETLWGGGHLKGGRYFIVCLTNGNQPVRAKEFRRILKASGSKGVILNYPDIYRRVKNDWTLVRPAVRADISRAVAYRCWDKIVTYNPDGVTGHIHHRMTYADTLRACRTHYLTGRLYYFGTYYKRGKVPKKLPAMAASKVAFKKKLLGLYRHERRDIKHYWQQMVPYEHWVACRDWPVKKG